MITHKSVQPRMSELQRRFGSGHNPAEPRAMPGCSEYLARAVRRIGGVT
jgi:putative component of membrane protein insertase Oxa1/YidC/SpoIIIJ protein YidD